MPIANYYLGIVESGPDRAFGLWFPDMPGCFPSADELSDLPRIAAEVLRQHVEALERNGRPIPPPRILDGAPDDTTVLIPLLAH